MRKHLINLEKAARGLFKQKDMVYFYETLECGSTMSLLFSCMRHSLEFDMQHDHIIKKVSFWPQTKGFKLHIKFSSGRLIDWIIDAGISLKSKKGGKDHESIQSSTTTYPGYQWESENVTIRLHNREPRGEPFLSR